MVDIPSGNERQASLKLGKCWQGTKPVIIWQVSPWGAEKGKFPKKQFLILECQQAKRGVTLRSLKPSQIKLGGGISALLRKHIPAGTVRQILRHKEDKHIWVPIYQGGVESPLWYLMLSYGKPPELSLISHEGTTLFRFGQKGTFTKRKECELTLPHKDSAVAYENILTELLEENALDPSLEGGEVEKKVKTEADEPISDNASDLQRDAKQKLSRRIKTVKKSLEKQQKAVPSQETLDLLSTQANLLQSYAYLVKPEQVSLKLEPALTGLDEVLEIELEPEWTVGKNVEEYFVRLKKRKKSIEHGSKMLAKISRELTDMEKDLERIKSLDASDDDILSILKRYKIELTAGGSKGASSAKSQEAVPYKIFKGLDNAEYLVGKGPSENDLLTKKAKSNDYWLHLIGGGGSHVVVPKRSLGKDGLSSEIKREAAILAVHFSKVRQDRSGEVYVTQRRHLRKQKGLPVGLWLVDQSETFFI